MSYMPSTDSSLKEFSKPYVCGRFQGEMIGADMYCRVSHWCRSKSAPMSNAQKYKLYFWTGRQMMVAF